MNTLTGFSQRLKDGEENATQKCEDFLRLLESCGEEGRLQAALCREHGSYLNKFLLCVLGNENKWFNVEEFPHDPNTEELVTHFLPNGARKLARDFCSKVRGDRKCVCFLAARIYEGIRH